MSQVKAPLGEQRRRAAVILRVQQRMGRESLTYAQAAAAIGIGKGSLINAVRGDVDPGPKLTAKCEEWLGETPGEASTASGA